MNKNTLTTNRSCNSRIELLDVSVRPANRESLWGGIEFTDILPDVPGRYYNPDMTYFYYPDADAVVGRSFVDLGLSRRSMLMIYFSKQRNFCASYYPNNEVREEEAVRIIRNRIEDRAKQEREKVRYRERVRTYIDSLEVGTILYGSWGYEQTNVEFYEIIRKKGKATVVLRKLAQREVNQTGPMSSEVVAVRGKYVGPEISKIVRGTSISFDHFCLSEWDGSPCYSSSYA